MAGFIEDIGSAKRAVLLRRKKELLEQQLADFSEQDEPESEFDPNVPTSEFLLDRFKKGAGLGLGAPVDIVQMLSQSLLPNPGDSPLTGATVAPQEPLAGQVLGDMLGFQGVKPPSSGAKMGGRIVEEVGAGLPFSPIPITKGASLLKNVLGNTGLSLLSGTGAAVGQQATGGIGGEITGQLGLGAVAPSVLANKLNQLKNVPSALKNAKDGILNSELISTGREQGIVKAFSREVPINAGQFPDEVQDVVQAQADEIARRQAIFSEVPNVRPTLGAVTGSGPIRQREADTAARSAINEAERIQLDQSNKLSLSAFAESGIPVSDKKLAVIARERRKSLTREQASLDKELLGAQNKINELSAINTVDLEDAGNTIRSQHAVESEKLKTEAGRLYGNALNKSKQSPDLSLEAEGVVSLFKQYKADPLFELSPQDMPNIFARLNRFVKSADDAVEATGGTGAADAVEEIATKVDYEEYSAMRQAVNQDIQVELARTVPNRRRIRALSRMKKRIDGMGKQVEQEAPELFKLDQEANTFYRTEVAPKLFRGINQKLGLGEDRLFNEKVIANYWKPKGITNIRRFKALYGNNDTANAALEGGVMQMYKDAVVKNGSIDILAHSRFMKRFESNFNEFPKLRQSLQDRATATDTLNLRSQELADNIDEINSSIWLKYKDFGGKEPRKIIDEALKNPRTMSRTVLGMPKNSREAFSASLLSDIYERSRGTDGSINPKVLDKLILDNSEAIQTGLRHGFGATKARSHMKRLRLISDAADILSDNTVSVGQTQGGVRNINIGGFDTGVPLTTAVSQARAVQTGRTGIHYVLSVLATQTGLNANKQMSEALEKKLLYDPDASLELVRMFKEQTRTGVPNVERMKEFVFKATGFVFGKGQLQRNLVQTAPKLGLEGRTEEFGRGEQQ
jgi:hypothetical protein